LDTSGKLNHGGKQIMSEECKTNFQVFTTRLDDYKILGILFTAVDPRKMGEYYGIYEKNHSLRNLINKHSKTGDREIGTMYPPNPSVQNEPEDFLVGGIVKRIDEAPEGACIMDFPASEFLVTTHEWCSSEKELMESGFIGQTVVYAHSKEVKIPNGYERYEYPVGYREHWNFNADENKFRMEVWFAIRKI
jgi:predicted transcriptional regulator YdeE